MPGLISVSSTPIEALPKDMAFISGFGSIIIAETSLVALYAATVPFITRETDVPANQPFSGTLEASLRIDRSIIQSDGFGGFSENISELSLINADAEYDSIADQVSLNGQQIRVSIGVMEGDGITVSPFAEFEYVANLIAERFVISRQRLTIELRDPGLHLTTETVQQSIYDGTGGLNGGETLQGKRRPFADGIIFNASPALVIPAELLYQFNDGAVSNITDVRDSGLALTFLADYANVASLRADAANIPPGFYGTCLAGGYFALGGSPVGVVTCDIVGLRTTTADIIENVALISAGLTASELNGGSFATVNADQPAEVGYYLDANSNETCAQMFSNLMHGIGGWHGMTPLGQLTLGIFTAPESIESTADYDSMGGDLVDIDRTALPQGLDPPPHRRRVIYARNYTVMTDLAGAVSENDPEFATQLRAPFQTAVTSDADSEMVLVNYPDAPDTNPVEAYFAYVEDAQVEADRLMDLYSQGRNAYRMTLTSALFLHEIGDVITVTDDRFGLETGRSLRLVALSDDVASMSTEAVAFG
jgi:hypothetical protein